MSIVKWSFYVAACGIVAVTLTGCKTVYKVPLGQRTPTECGNVKLYGTENVPFEYEEISTIALMYQHTPQDECLRQFVAEAQRLGADAVLNFMLEPVNDTGGFMFVGTAQNTTLVKGVAVKIKRP